MIAVADVPDGRRRPDVRPGASFLRCAKEQCLRDRALHGTRKQRLYGVLDARLGEARVSRRTSTRSPTSRLIPWVARYEWHKIDLGDFPNVKRWFDAISARPAVQRGMKVPRRL